ncbi:MAG: hypothetical protein M1142_03840 [Patescibacteria group bacterium]|nr:hypothetical protein [Patescibacteria group bacterium]
MKKIFFKNILSILILTAAFLLFPKFALASTLYLSPGSGNIPVGGVVSFQVRLNTGGEGVNAVSAFLSYPADKLDVAWVSPSGTFGIEAERSFGGGIIKISRGNLSPVSGNVSVATIGFRGKTEGSATVAFIGGSSAPRASDSSDSLNLGGSSGGTYTVTAGGAGAGSSNEAGNGTAPTAGPQISDIAITNISSTSATVTWKTSAPADSLIEYGLEPDRYFLNISNGDFVTSHKIKVESDLFLPGNKVYFQIKSKDEFGNMTTSPGQNFQLQGYRIKIKVVDDNGQPLSGIKVMLYSDPQEGVTDENGEVVFINVTPGNHLAVAKLEGGDKAMEVNVKGVSLALNSDSDSRAGTPSTAQTAGTSAEVFPLQVDNSLISKKPSFWAEGVFYLILGMVVGAVLAARFWVIKRRAKKAILNNPLEQPQDPDHPERNVIK